MLWMICSFDAFDQLYTNRRRSVEHTVEILIGIAEAAVCRPVGPT
jgi:hypothetical protein